MKPRTRNLQLATQNFKILKMKPTYQELLFENELLEEKAKKLVNENISLKKRIQYIEEIIDEINGVFYLNDTTKPTLMVWANPKNTKRIFGNTLAERLSMTPKEHKNFYHPDDYHIINKARKYIEINDILPPLFYRIKHKSGKWLWICSIGSVLKRKPDGQPWLVIAIAFDFTPRVKFQFPNFDEYSKDYFAEKNKDLIQLLTKKEREIISHLSHGLTTKEVAALLFNSYHTINTHKRNAMSKLKFNKITDLIAFATKAGLNKIKTINK